jgi:NADH-quinone oxidoreductase subunit J
MSAGSLWFIVCGVACLVGAVSTIAAKNPIRCAVGLLATIVSMAGLFLSLQAQFLAAIQLIVYAGAVVVLFVFVIMLLGPDAGPRDEPYASEATGRIARGFSIVAVLGMLVVSVLLLAVGSEAPTAFSPVPANHGTVEAVGGLLFTKGLVPFELATILLIVAVVGAIALARSNHPKKQKRRVESATKRMFHGPVVPRDAGGPSVGPSALAAERLAKEGAE